MNRLQRYLLESGTTRDELQRAEIDIVGPFVTRVFGKRGQQSGQRYEMNARGNRCDPLACRASESWDDTPRTVYYARLGTFGLGSSAVRSHLADRPRLP